MTRPPFQSGEKPLHWVGSSKRDFLTFPQDVVSDLGYALGVAQLGGKHPHAKPWKGEGQGVFEIVENHDGDTYRAVYTVRFEGAIYVLHAFQKKSPSGIRTATSDIDLISERLKRAREDHERSSKLTEATMDIEHGSTNVFADLGMPDPVGRQTKTRLALEINTILKARKLRQTSAASLLGIPQSKVSALVNYRLEGFSVERLMGFLTSLNQDVEIMIRPSRGEKEGHVSVHALR